MMGRVEEIKAYIPKYDYFVGVDSDGSAFDTMKIKHNKVFIPLAVKIWGLEKVEKAYEEVAETINLYSEYRGINRFSGLLLSLELLSKRPEIMVDCVSIPDFTDLKKYIDYEKTYSNSTLKSYMKEHESKFLEEVLQWSEEGDGLMKVYTEGNPPFKFVMESLEKVSQQADTMIVSSASTSALYHEWGQTGLLVHMQLVAGQEVGPKKEQLDYATRGKYHNQNILLIGDAPSDLQAAKENNALFYPIIPGEEEVSWKKFHEEAFDKFIKGLYAGEYEEELVDKFFKSLNIGKH
jgi:phosphoglycolate phosphatase-like HAD superfamily hydrolase